jgi:hypothetical protein
MSGYRQPRPSTQIQSPAVKRKAKHPAKPLISKRPISVFYDPADTHCPLTMFADGYRSPLQDRYPAWRHGRASLSSA